ncbi:methyltransferase domain-containing protein [Prochlorococcus marinus]|uniref:methyltransferase domain-containing protein n=1 Tax=Prochlorococcus marinus TaxID=1219 RepID=UPI0022B42330|nr:class I SAM-dependent methyltransferase [Prochlorococcus marinus]
MKYTTQLAPLEKFLSTRRSNRIKRRYNNGREIILNKKVLDFGCGLSGWTASAFVNKASIVHGMDTSLIKTKILNNGVSLFPNFNLLPFSDYQVITSFAVFEHIYPYDLIYILNKIYNISTNDAIIFATTPTPLSKPILEFLSFRLKLIDSSQIKDHKIYYDNLWLKYILSNTAWEIETYSKFQFGLNSQFILKKKFK